MRLLFAILCGLLIGIPLAVAEKQPAKQHIYVKAVISGAVQGDARESYKFTLNGKDAQALADKMKGIEEVVTSDVIEPPSSKKYGRVTFTRNDDTELTLHYNDSEWQREDSFPFPWAKGSWTYLDKLIAKHKKRTGRLPR